MAETSSSSTNEVLNQAFREIDVDSSGTIEKKELLKALMFNERVSTILHQFEHLLPLLKPKHFEQAFMEMNTAHDNHVTVQEFISFAIGITIRETLTNIFCIITGDTSASVDKKECLSQLSTNQAIEDLIKKYDRLNYLKDITAYETQFLRTDTNVDDKVTLDEFIDILDNVVNTIDSSLSPLYQNNGIDNIQVTVTHESDQNGSDLTSKDATAASVQNRDNNKSSMQSRSEITEELYNSLSAGNDNELVENVLSRLKSCGVSLTMEQYAAIKSELKSNNSGMTLDDFRNKILIFSRENEHASTEEATKTGKQIHLIRQLFKVGDTKDTGEINVKDFHRLLYELQLQYSNIDMPKSEDDVQRIFSNLDKDKSGVIEEQEFVQWVSSGLAKDNRESYKRKSSFHRRMGGFLDAVEKALSSESPESYLKKRINDLFSEFADKADGRTAILNPTSLKEMLRYLTAFRPELDLPHSDSDIKGIISGLGHDNGLFEDDFVGWIHDGISQSPEELVEFAQQDPFNNKMVNFLDAVRSWLREDAEYIAKGNQNMIQNIKVRSPQITRLFRDFVPEDANFLDENMAKLLIYDVALLAQNLEMPRSDEVNKVLEAFDTNKDGKVDLDDFLEYMVGSLSRSTRMREHYKSLSDFNCRMENLVQGLLVALDKDPVEEMHIRAHQLLSKYADTSKSRIFVDGMVDLFTSMKQYSHGAETVLESEEDAIKLLALLGENEPNKGIEEDHFIVWLNNEFTKSPEDRTKLKAESPFHAKVVRLVETIFAYIKMHRHNSDGSNEVGIFFDVKKMGISFREEQDSDGTTFLTLDKIQEWSPAAVVKEVEAGCQLVQVDKQRIANGGFNKLKEILDDFKKQNPSTSKIKLTFREIEFGASMAYKKESRKRRHKAIEKASAKGHVMVIFYDGPIGITFKEIVDRSGGKTYIAVASINENGQASDSPALKVGQHLEAIGTTDIAGKGLREVIEILQITPRPVEFTLADDEVQRQYILKQMQKANDNNRKPQTTGATNFPKKEEGKLKTERKQLDQQKRRPMQLRHLFDEYDLEGTGHLRKEDLSTMLFELSVICPNLQLPRSENDLNVLMQILDDDGNGTIEKQEFVNWVCKGLSMTKEQRQKFRSGNQMRQRLDCFLIAVEKALSQQPAEVLRQRMHKLFDYFDQDRSGTIDTIELHDMIQELSLMTPHTELPTTDADLKEILKALAHNDSGIIHEIDLINWLYNGVATTPESRRSFSRESDFNRRLVNLLEALIAWLRSPDEITNRLMPTPGTRPRRRKMLSEQSSLQTDPKTNVDAKKMTVEEMKAAREKQEMTEFERLRVKAKEKQRAKLTAIRKAESEMVAKTLRSSKKINNNNVDDIQLQNIREKHKKHQINRKNKIQAGRQKQKEEKIRQYQAHHNSQILMTGQPGPNILPPMNMAHGNNTQLKQTKEGAPMTKNNASFEAQSLGLTASPSQFHQQPIYMQQNVMHAMPQVHMYQNGPQPQYGQQPYMSPQQPPSNAMGVPNHYQPSPLQKRVQGYPQQQYGNYQ